MFKGLDLRKYFDVDIIKSAAENGHLEIVKILLDHDFDRNVCLEYAARGGHKDILEYVFSLKDTKIPSKQHMTLLRAACCSNNIEIVQYMISKIEERI